MRLSIILFIAVLVTGMSALAQEPILQAYSGNKVEVKAGSPVTYWFCLALQNRKVDWKKVTVLGAFSIEQLDRPRQIPGIGELWINPARLVHFDPNMSVRQLTGNPSNDSAIVWTRLPAVSPALIGTRVFYQALLWNNDGPPVYTLSNIADQFTILPA